MPIQPDFELLDLVEAAPGVGVPRRFSAKVWDLGDLPCDLELEAQLEGGRFVLTRLCGFRREGGPALTSEILRAVPVARVLRAVLEAITHDVSRSGDGRVHFSMTRVDREAGPTDENLRRVARVYRGAHLVGMPPTKAVQDHFGLARSTAGRWVMEARRQGFLGPGTERQAGEREADGER